MPVPRESAARPAAIHLKIKVVPGASRSEIVGWLGDALKIRVSKPPEKGKANREVEALVSDALSLAPGSVRVVRGERSQRKVLEISGVTYARVQECLGVDRF